MEEQQELSKFRRPYKPHNQITKMSSKMKAMEKATIKGGQRVYHRRQLFLCKSFLQYISKFDEELQINEQNLFYILRVIRQQSQEQSHSEHYDPKNIQEIFKQFFLQIMKKEQPDSEDEFDEELSVNQQTNKKFFCNQLLIFIKILVHWRILILLLSKLYWILYLLLVWLCLKLIDLRWIIILGLRIIVLNLRLLIRSLFVILNRMKITLQIL